MDERQGGREVWPVVPVRPAVLQQPHLGQLRDLLRLSVLLRVWAMGRLFLTMLEGSGGLHGSMSPWPCDMWAASCDGYSMVDGPDGSLLAHVRIQLVQGQSLAVRPTSQALREAW